MNELIINKENLVHNINVIKNEVKDDYTIISVVKGNAYGLGVLEFIKILKENNLNYFAVAEKSEALYLRDNNIKEKILLLSPYLGVEDLEELIENDIILTIDSKECFKNVNEIALKLNKKVCAHIKVDTGLSRYGFDYNDISDIKYIFNNTSNIEFEGIYSHFSNSLSNNPSFSNIQYNRFINVIKKLEEDDINFKLKHICNSSGFFKYQDMRLNAARIGSAYLANATGIKTNLKAICTLHTKILKIRNVKKGDYIGYANSYKVKNDMKIAIIPVGYHIGIGKVIADQRFRFKSKIKKVLLSFQSLFKDNNMCLVIDNKCIKVLGQIGMHDIVIDITNLKYKENDDLYINVRPQFIDSNVKRVYK